MKPHLIPAGESRHPAKGAGDSMGGIRMKKTLLLASVAIASLTSAASAADLKVCVSWSNFREERWKTDEAAIKGALDAAGEVFGFGVAVGMFVIGRACGHAAHVGAQVGQRGDVHAHVLAPAGHGEEVGVGGSNPSITTMTS